VFREKQLQSFLGVGAQHQNSKAERAIQIIMYMACTFLVHSSLHWTNMGADDISLWPFAVKHVVWLYNCVPNFEYGLTPMELLTKQKADHRDILRSHVWGCPLYVLKSKLQNGQKLPKWNCRSRLGQFLGYSDEPSSLVANIWHLKTGLVSPQYHVVFDDLFKTVFSSGANNALVTPFVKIYMGQAAKSMQPMNMMHTTTLYTIRLHWMKSGWMQKDVSRVRLSFKSNANVMKN
jgi:hypothetical protein